MVNSLVVMGTAMSLKSNILILIGAGVLLIPIGGTQAQNYYRERVLWTVHNQGKLQMTLSNVGVIGDVGGEYWPDPLTGTMISNTVYPRNSGIEWGLGAGPIVGGVIDRDTQVTAWEFLPDEPPDNQFRYETIDITSPMYSPQAHSEFDIICQYNDSIDDPREVPSNHRPLNIRIKQRSMAWSASNIDDFIIFDLEISNIGSKVIRHGYAGVEGHFWVRHVEDGWSNGFGLNRNLAGSIDAYGSVVTCGVPDSQFICYGMSVDGRPGAGVWDRLSLVDAMGVTILGQPGLDGTTSFSWRVSGRPPDWSEFIPVKQGDSWKVNWQYKGDKNWYYLLSSGRTAYDEMFTAVNHTDDGWEPPPPDATEIASGLWPNLLLGVGPFDLGPGQKAHFTYAIVGGENVHVNPTDFANYWDPYNPELYYSKLDFTELATNARWAKWVFDNPGVDSDGDGYFGKFRVCDGDTSWYEGDGVPDFRADVPPPSPKLKVIPSIGKLVLRWNGYYSENAIDPFTKVKDFEGYRVYMALDDRESSFSTLISWDYPNYNRYFLREKPNHTFAWETKDLPFTIDSLRILYGDSFSPLLYTKDNPLHVSDTQYSFASVDYNLSSFLPDGVHKVYPDAINPGTDSTQWTEDQLTSEHGSPMPKYYEYEYIIENVLPTVANYISVTSFDFGFAKGNIPAKESSKRENQTIAYAQTSADSVEANDLNVYIYPNPYIWQKDYHSLGYENRDNTQIPARSHRINFGNLPPKCRISVFSLDGDLIRSWEHNYDSDDPQGMHDSWDLITRNTMLAVAGLYYWVVESADRTQIGKLVIIE